MPLNHTTGSHFKGTKFFLLFAVFHLIPDLEFKEKVFDIRSVRKDFLCGELGVLPDCTDHFF